MLLKRIYDPADLERFQAEQDAGVGNPLPPKLAYVALAHTGVEPEQNFSIQFVTEGLQRGLMEIHDDELFFQVAPETLRYTIKRRPGHYCLVCGEKLESDASGALARLHVSEKHPGTTGPGYEKLNHFECVLDGKQHEKYRIKQPARAPKFHLKEADNG